MAITSKKVTLGDEIKAADHNTLVDDMTELDGKKVKWSDVDGKPTTFAPATHKHSYTDLENKPTIPTVPSKMTAAEATTGTATTARLIDAKTLNDVIDAKIAAANTGGAE